MEEIRKNKIKQSLKETKARRTLLSCKVIECKIDKSSLSKSTLETLYKIFLEGKWLYNSILALNNINEMNAFNTKVKSVPVKIKNKFENRELNNISSQMKQGIKSRIFSSLSTLSVLKAKGYKIGKLKFKSEIKCIPLKQHGNTFTILKQSNRIRIQGIKKPLKVNGLDQLNKLSSYEIGNANLVKVGNNFYVKITVFVPKEKEIPIVPDKTIGIDFGCTTQLTLSNGEKIEYQVPISKRLKKLDKSLARKVKNSKNKYKILDKRIIEYNNLTNKRKEIKNQIVSKLVKNYKTICFQDEQLNNWKQKGHGKKVQFSAMGGIISALQRKAVTPIVVGKYYPSTQTCSQCGNRQKMKQNERTYLCKSCGNKIDRDINAAINIEKEGEKIKKILAERKDLKPVEIRTSANLPEIREGLKVQSVKQETQGSLVLG
jgi:transposase